MTPGFVWGPEGLSEADAGLLGDVRPAAGSSRSAPARPSAPAGCWRGGADPVALDLSGEMLRRGRELGAAAGLAVPLVQADAARLPFAARVLRPGLLGVRRRCRSWPTPPRCMREVARVLRRGGRWVFSVTHPLRWAFPDDPGPEAAWSCGTRTSTGRPTSSRTRPAGATYVEHHRTLGDRVRELTAAGFRLVDLVEPEWPADNDRTWGAWSPLRGRLVPGTAIFVCVRG